MLKFSNFQTVVIGLFIAVNIKSAAASSGILHSRTPHTASRNLQKRATISFDVPAFGPNPDDASQVDFFDVGTCEDKEDEIRGIFDAAQNMARNAAQDINDPNSAELLNNLFSFGGQPPAVNTIAQIPLERLNAAANTQNVYVICEGDNKNNPNFGVNFMGAFPGECDKVPAPNAASYSLSHGYFASLTDRTPAEQVAFEQKFGGLYMILCDRGLNQPTLEDTIGRFNLDTEQQEEDGIEPGQLLQDGLCDYGNNQVSTILHELMHLSSFDLSAADPAGHGPNLIDDLARRMSDCFALGKGQSPQDPALNAESYALYGLAVSEPFNDFDWSHGGEKAGR